jgi:hypothetical protein
MQTRPFASTPDARSPAGAEIRHRIDGETGGMIHSTVPRVAVTGCRKARLAGSRAIRPQPGGSLR